MVSWGEGLCRIRLSLLDQLLLNQPLLYRRLEALNHAWQSVIGGLPYAPSHHLLAQATAAGGYTLQQLDNLAWDAKPAGQGQQRRTEGLVILIRLETSQGLD